LRWRIHADDAARVVLVPPMIVQTLVENAVKHGVALRPEGGDVHVSATGAGGELRVRVTNPGDVVGVRDGGIGLANSRDRLRLLYGDRARLDVSPDGAGRVVAELVLPGEEGT
jgi:LytS/YehU family sensor histidine kinase